MTSNTSFTLESLTFQPKPPLYTEDIAFWRILYKLDREFLLTVEHFFFYGTGDSVLVWTRDGRVYSYGLNFNGVLGVGPKREGTTKKPLEVVELRDKQIMQAASSFFTVMILTVDGDLFGWGNNSSGQVGIGTKSTVYSPVLVKSKVGLVCCGFAYTLALDLDGGVWCWGQNQNGQLGTGDKRDRSTPHKLKFSDTVVDLQCNIMKAMHQRELNLALTAGHEVYIWGSVFPWNAPNQIKLPCTSPVVAIAPSNNYFLLFTANGEAYRGNDSLKFYQVELPEPVASVPLVSKEYVVVAKTVSEKLLCLRTYSNGETLVAQSSLTSPADLYVFYGGGFQCVTPGLVKITDKARAILDNFNNPQRRPLDLSPHLCVNRALLAKKQPYFKKMCHLGVLMMEEEALFSEHVVYSYIHYLHRGTLIDKSELVYPLWTQAYYFHDDQLHRSLTKEISSLLCHLYLRHRDALVSHLKQHLLEFRNSFTNAVKPLFNPTTRLDISLQALIIRWLILRALFILPRSNSRNLVLPVRFFPQTIFESSEIDPRHVTISTDSEDEWPDF